MQQYFMIVSRMHGLALDVQGGNRNPGAAVVPWNRTGSDNQLWYDDHATGTIRSKLNGLCLDIEGTCSIVKAKFHESSFLATSSVTCRHLVT